MGGNMSIVIVVVILGVLLGIALLVGLFFLFRAITCWYFKINKMLNELKKIDAHLETIARLTEQNLVVQQRASNNVAHAVAPAPAAPVAPAYTSAPEVASAYVQPSDVAPAARFCANCGTQLPDGEAFCRACGTNN